MMGTLSAVLAGKKISTSIDNYKAEITGDIKNINGLPKITRINVQYHLKTDEDKKEAAKEALKSYIKFCPAAQSVIECIKIEDEIVFT